MQFKKLKNRLIKLRGSKGLNIGKILGEEEEHIWIGKKRERYRTHKLVRVVQHETNRILMIYKRNIIQRKGKLRERGSI